MTPPLPASLRDLPGYEQWSDDAPPCEFRTQSIDAFQSKYIVSTYSSFDRNNGKR